MGYRNDIEALQHRLRVMQAERDQLKDEVESLRHARDDAEAKIRREAYLRKELTKLRELPGKLANSKIRARQLEARVRELRNVEAPPATPPKQTERNLWLAQGALTVAVVLFLVLAVLLGGP